MNIYFDTEFTGLHKDTTLISIGLIDEDDYTFYAELTDYDKSQCDEWIEKNVISHLSLGTKPMLKIEERNWTVVGNKAAVAKALSEWLSEYDEVELVSDVCHYDMVLFIDLFGGAFDIPDNVAPVCHDINQDIAEEYFLSQQEAFDGEREKLITTKIDGDKHNALYDAKVIKAIYESIKY